MYKYNVTVMLRNTQRRNIPSELFWHTAFSPHCCINRLARVNRVDVRQGLAFLSINVSSKARRIFAVNDLQHASHADEVVRTCKEVYGKGDDFFK